ncbi:TetR/AcrR family transcriptional regulator [Jidongwangia harbinensis]|uniref:TetR/AcrR family transcriptional regulator n=1 Tax=Jidongwangia harbinensis TaxID=2878561 RepID=UPI001CD98D67|nr:TetR family transcriptional regulator [Jidongwangia harbinensis]MCA2217187.1 TetR/AcrR family transcriptional regulator [Jidongwangia harbinensis]
MSVTATESSTRERTRRAILLAAIATLIAKPNASLGEVADAAEVARSTLHRYYPSRAALIAALNAFVDAEYEAAVKRSRPDTGSGLEAYERLCAELLDAHQIFYWWTQSVHLEEDRKPEYDPTVQAVLRRGQEDGTIDRRLDPEWLEMSIWPSLLTAYQYAVTSHRSRHEAREMALRTLIKIAAA